MSRPTPSNTALARRLDAVEARLAELEGPYAEHNYRTRRELAGVRIEMGRLLDQAGLPRATAAEIDDYLDQE
jgi:hypothetical protein